MLKPRPRYADRKDFLLHSSPQEYDAQWDEEELARERAEAYGEVEEEEELDVVQFIERTLGQ